MSRWWDQAACADNPDFLRAQAPEQKQTCAGCPVRAECLEEALRIEEPGTVRLGWPVYGGLDGGERRLLLTPPTDLAKAKGGRGKKPIVHGTRNGAQQHRYRGERPCDACLAAQREHARRHYRQQVAS